MTPTQLEDFVRQRYNATGDGFWSSSEIRNLIWDAEMQLSVELYVLENTFTTTSVLSQRTYSYPANTLAIKRIEYSGRKLMPTSFREDDALTLSDTTSTQTGTPQYYSVWDNVIYLRPIPDAAGKTITIYSYDKPAQITTASSALSVDERFHLDIVSYVLSEFYAKDGNFNAANRYRQLWDNAKMTFKKAQRRRVRGDGFSGVQDYEVLPSTIIGVL